MWRKDGWPARLRPTIARLIEIARSRNTDRTTHDDSSRRSSVDPSLGAGRHCGRYYDHVRKLRIAITATTSPECCRVVQRLRGEPLTGRSADAGVVGDA